MNNTSFMNVSNLTKQTLNASTITGNPTNAESVSVLAELTSNIVDFIHDMLGQAVMMSFSFAGVELSATETGLILSLLAILLAAWRLYTLSSFLRTLLVSAVLIIIVLVSLSILNII